MLFRYCSEVDWVWFEFDFSPGRRWTFHSFEFDHQWDVVLTFLHCVSVFSVSPPLDVVPKLVGGGLGAARPLLYCS